MRPTSKRVDKISVEDHARAVEREDAERKARSDIQSAARAKIVKQVCNEMAESHNEEFMKVFESVTFKIPDIVEFHNDSDADSSPFESLAYIRMLSFAQELGMIDNCWVKYYIKDDPQAEFPLPFLGATLSESAITDSQKRPLQEFYESEIRAIEELQS